MSHFPGTYEDEIGSTDRIMDDTDLGLLSYSRTLSLAQVAPAGQKFLWSQRGSMKKSSKCLFEPSISPDPGLIEHLRWTERK